MHAVDRNSTSHLYRQVIDLLTETMDAGTLLPGDRLPSLRRMSEQIGVSIPTVRQAYIELERQRRVESRPQSGFYVRGRHTNDIVRPASSFEAPATRWPQAAEPDGAGLRRTLLTRHRAPGHRQPVHGTTRREKPPSDHETHHGARRRARHQLCADAR